MRRLLLLILTTGCASSPIARSRSAHHVFLVQPLDDLGLFADESRQSEGVLAAWAVANGFAVVPVDRAERVFARAEAGQRVDADPAGNVGPGPACGLPLARGQAESIDARALGADGELTASVSCDAKTHACTLSVTAFDADGNAVSALKAPYDARAPWTDALPRALAALGPDHIGDGRFGMFGIGDSDERVVANPERLSFAVMPARADDPRDSGALEGALTFDDGDASLRACFGHDDDGTEARMAIDASGQITRCQARDADDALSRCACAALVAHVHLGPALRETRADVSVSFEAADVVTRWGGKVTASVNTYVETYRDRLDQQLLRPKVSDPAIAAWVPPAQSAIARCFSDLPGPGRSTFGVRVTFDGAGTARAVQITKGPALTPSERSCVEAAFARARAPCPTAPGATADATLDIQARALTRKP